MAVVFNPIWEEIVRATKCRNNPDEQKRFRRQTNSEYATLMAMESWADARDVSEVSWAGDAVVIPSDAQGIDMVWDTTHEVEYISRNHAAARHAETAFTYFTRPTRDPLLTVPVTTLAQGATAYTHADLEGVASLVGEYMLADDGEPQRYRIDTHDTAAGVVTFSPSYRRTEGDGAGSGFFNFIVRPPDTLYLEVQGPYNTEIPAATLEIHYWRRADTLLHPGDLVLLPTADLLIKKTLSNIREAAALRPITKSMVDEAMAEARMLNPDRPRPRIVKGIHGRPTLFGQNHYADARGSQFMGAGEERMRSTWIRNRI